MYTSAMAKTYQFPKDFLWGTATAAFQTEGNNKNTEWWEWENTKPKDRQYPLEKSGIACDSYNRYEEDLDLCVKLNNNAVRFSIEWARIQPDENTFDQNEIDHYKKVITAAKKRNLKTFVTLYHFTLPLWFGKKGGWSKGKNIKYFETYVTRCAQEFGPLVDAFITMNEPLVYSLAAYLEGMWPPGIEDLVSTLIVQHNLVNAHKRAYKAIKAVGNYYTGMVENINYFDYKPGFWAPVGYLVSKLLTFFNVDFHLAEVKNHLDFFGVHFYFSTRFNGVVRENLDDVQSDLGWWVYPPGFERVLLHIKRLNVPIYITENGVADAMDRIRKDFIKNMLIACHNAMEQGVDVRGYFHWSLIDNYEWHQGFWPKFGLVYIDYKNNCARIPRDSFYYYADICKNGRILE